MADLGDQEVLVGFAAPQIGHRKIPASRETGAPALADDVVIRPFLIFDAEFGQGVAGPLLSYGLGSIVAGPYNSVDGFARPSPIRANGAQ